MTNKIIHGKRTNIKLVQDWAITLGGKLISSVYKNMLGPLEWQCGCGHNFVTTFNHVKNRKQWCPKCGNIKRNAALRIRMQTSDTRKKISDAHLKRLKKSSYFCGRTQRDISKRLRDNITGLFRNYKKHQRVLKYIGCTFMELKSHLESLFLPGMTWENRGFYGWHIDHKVPLSHYNLQDEQQIYLSCHYTNLQPLWAKDNQHKHNKIQ
jgi:hypothetical protein